MFDASFHTVCDFPYFWNPSSSRWIAKKKRTAKQTRTGLQDPQKTINSPHGLHHSPCTVDRSSSISWLLFSCKYLLGHYHTQHATISHKPHTAPLQHLTTVCMLYYRSDKTNPCFFAGNNYRTQCSGGAI